MVTNLVHTFTSWEYEFDYSNGKSYRLINMTNEMCLSDDPDDPTSCMSSTIEDCETGEELSPKSELYAEIMKALEDVEE